MLQFFIGLTTLNISWLLAGLMGGLRFYNSSPLFFIAAVGLLHIRFYSTKALRIIGFIFFLELAPGLITGFDIWHVRQAVALVVASVIWIFVYQYASKRDLFTLNRTIGVLGVYLLYLILVSVENIVGVDTIAYAVSCVFSWSCGSSAGYANVWRMPYFSTEASSAGVAITASIMPFICARVLVKRNALAVVLLIVSLIILYFAEGLTSRAFVLYSILFVILPRITVLSIPVFMILIIIVAAAVSSVLEEKGALVALVQSWFGGISSRVDLGIETGSYTSRFMNWLIGARAFMSSPLIGVGIGGTQSFFYQLYDSGLYVDMGEEQGKILDNSVSAYNSPMVVRIPAEVGLVGTAFLVYQGWRAFRLALRPRPGSLIDYAFLYSLGAMLLSFCFAAELLNPCIPAFVALLAQAQRSRSLETAKERATLPLVAAS